MIAIGLLASVVATAAGAEAPARLETDRRWDVLSPPSATRTPRGQLLQAADALGTRSITLAGVTIDAARLRAVARATPEPRLTAGLRDALGRPVDAGDLLLFLDDVLRAERDGALPATVFVTPGRARRHGILLHPDDVFGDGPRRYGEHGALAIDRPVAQRPDVPPARDGDPPGPGWAMRFRNPSGEQGRLEALTRETGDGDFEARLRALVAQLREQGAEVYVNSTVRRRERGYLMWGAFVLSRAEDEAAVRRALRRLDDANREWGLAIPIDWSGAGDWRATREAAREMAETYEVVYATERGARSSRHYGGGAIDLVAIDLPRRLSLVAPDGARRVFDLGEVDEPLDLSLTPALIDWIEAHFGLRKLRSDHPHWDDARSVAADPAPAGTGGAR